MGVFFSSSSISFLRKIVHFSSRFYVLLFCSPIPLVGGWSFVQFSGFCLYVFVRCWCSFLIFFFFFLSLIDLFVIVVDIINYFIYRNKQGFKKTHLVRQDNTIYKFSINLSFSSIRQDKSKLIK